MSCCTFHDWCMKITQNRYHKIPQRLRIYERFWAYGQIIFMSLVSSESEVIIKLNILKRRWGIEWFFLIPSIWGSARTSKDHHQISLHHHAMMHHTSTAQSLLAFASCGNWRTGTDVVELVWTRHRSWSETSLRWMCDKNKDHACNLACCINSTLWRNKKHQYDWHGQEGGEPWWQWLVNFEYCGWLLFW